MNNYKLEKIVNILKQRERFDFSAFHVSFIEKQIQSHMKSIGEFDFATYFNLINSQHDQLDCLMDQLTVNVSKFFRDPLTFEFIFQVILPKILEKKRRNGLISTRLWCAGCSYGEEAYTIAMLIKEALGKENNDLRTELFATDIDEKALEQSRNAIYGIESIENVQYRWLRKYFIDDNDRYLVSSAIKDMVSFSQFDLIDQKHHAPQESIFGYFDIVLCRNVLIYYKKEYQDIILSNLTRSLAPKGYLVLGESEILTETFHNQFSRATDFCKIYQKNN